MSQMTIYDVLEENIFDEIKEKTKKYDIDNIYISNFKSKDCLIKEIGEYLEKQSNYKEYINMLYNELKRYIPEINIDECLSKVGICWLNNSIRISQKRKCYSIWCLEMLDKEIFEEVKL